jgi:hypothetical protein
VARGGDERVLKAGDGTINGPFSAIFVFRGHHT